MEISDVDHLREKRDVDGLARALGYTLFRGSLDQEAVRVAAATALGEVGDPQAVRPLLAAWSAEDNSVTQVPRAALGAVDQLGARAVEPLTAVLAEHEDSNVRRVAAVKPQ